MNEIEFENDLFLLLLVSVGENIESTSILACRCEAFSTYPRTYDLIHAHKVFSMYIDK